MAIEKEKYNEDYIDELLDEAGPVVIAGIPFDPSRILQELDPIAYNCMLSDIQEYEYECEECGSVHDDEDDADECCQEDEGE